MMKIRDLFRRLVAPRNSTNGALRYLASVERFRRSMQRERQRSDRSQTPFALLVIDKQTRDGRLLEIEPLAALLEARLRMTDEAGMMADGRVGVILPDTIATGAWKLTEHICGLCEPDQIPGAFEVYVYPTNADGDNGDPAGILPESLTGPTEPVRPLEALFVQVLPPWKRVIDVAGASAVLLVLSPLMLVAAAAVKLSSRGPVFFSQWRDGLGGRPFRIQKFRTMRVGADAEKAQLRSRSEQDGPAFKMKEDPRVTRVGKFLRATSIDELPQLWNVLTGDMSLVGPRPLPCDESAQCAPWQRRRLEATPGITCTWQVSGRSKISFDDWVRMDVRYLGSRTFGNDLKLLARTIPAVLSRKGAQ